MCVSCVCVSVLLFACLFVCFCGVGVVRTQYYFVYVFCFCFLLDFVSYCLYTKTQGRAPRTHQLRTLQVGAQGYQRFPGSKPVVGQDIACMLTT